MDLYVRSFSLPHAAQYGIGIAISCAFCLDLGLRLVGMVFTLTVQFFPGSFHRPLLCIVYMGREVGGTSFPVNDKGETRRTRKYRDSCSVCQVARSSLLCTSPSCGVRKPLPPVKGVYGIPLHQCGVVVRVDAQSLGATTPDHDALVPG